MQLFNEMYETVKSQIVWKYNNNNNNNNNRVKHKKQPFECLSII